MKTSFFKSCTAATLLFLAFSACSQQETTLGNLHVIPLPQEITEQATANPFVIRTSTTICYPEGNEKMKRNAEFLASYIKEVAGTQVKVSSGTAASNCIMLETDTTLTNKEGYEMDINADRVIIKGGSEAAVFYGIQTLHKALPITNGQTLASLPAGTINDWPEFSYRGFLVDVGRHFFSVDYLKEVIDMLALHNINYFHWHLTEDQGWRIEIKKYPKLTEIGSHRKETIVAPGSDQFDNTPVSGYYTQEEAKEIVRYAAERYITVIPEIDMPGHMLATLASYPELGCTGGPYEVATQSESSPTCCAAGMKSPCSSPRMCSMKSWISSLRPIFTSEETNVRKNAGKPVPNARRRSASWD